ncbi:MAG: type IV pilus biogenesis/stability protein PilW [Candidatus Sedimenticola sp. (ex Thyasira tokunagai)]
MNNRITALLLLSALTLVVSGCQQGAVRPDVDMEDSTGQMGQESAVGVGDVYVKLAVGYMREGRLDVALKKARRALQVEPGNVEGHNIIALLYDRLNEPGLAERHFKRGLKLQPRHPYMLNAYGTFLCRNGRYEEADMQFQQALKNPLYTTPEVAFTNAGICAGRKPDPVQAERYLRQALERNPRLPTALIQMARVSYNNGEYLSSRAYLQRYLESARHTAASLWLGIQAERKLGDRNAVSSYSLLLRNSFPDSQEVLLLKESNKK